VADQFDVDQLPHAFVERLRERSQASARYIPGRYPGRIMLIRGRAQPVSRLQPYDLCWSALTADGVEVINVPGAHGGMLKPPFVEELARRLRLCLETAQSQAGERSNGEPHASLAPLAAAPMAYKVVVNDQGQYSIWPIDRANAIGWADTEFSGTAEECRAHIDETWTDLRPRSLREYLREIHGSICAAPLRYDGVGPFPTPVSAALPAAARHESEPHTG
jgi:MbtH protein